MTEIKLVPCPYCRDTWIYDTEEVCVSCIKKYNVDLILADLTDAVTRLPPLLSEISKGRVFLLEDAVVQLQSMIETIRSKS